MCLAQGPQRSDAGEARTHGPLVLSQAALPEPLHSHGYWWFQVLIISKCMVYKHAVVAAFCIYAQHGEVAAKRGGLSLCMK